MRLITPSSAPRSGHRPALPNPPAAICPENGAIIAYRPALAYKYRPRIAIPVGHEIHYRTRPAPPVPCPYSKRGRASEYDPHTVERSPEGGGRRAGSFGDRHGPGNRRVGAGRHHATWRDYRARAYAL